MSAAADSAPPWGSQDKAGSRNKRKFSVASGELAAIELECPTTVYYAGSEFMAAAAAGEGVNLDIPQNMFTFSGLESLESDWRMNWTSLDEVQLEELLLKGLDATFDNAVGLITAMGYSEAVGRAAVVIAAKQFQWKDGLAWFGKFAVEVAIDILKTKGSILREDVSVEIMRRCGRAVLTGVIDHVSDANPLSPRGDVMFCLLMSDMNAIRACTMVSTQAPSPAVAAQVIAQPVVGNYEPGLSSGVPASFTNPQTGDVIRGKLFTVAPGSFNPQAVRAHSSTVPACPNLSSSKPSVSGNMQCVISNMKPKEHTVAVPDHSEGQPFVAAATQASKDDKPFTSKTGSSKRDSSHRKKLMSSDKSSRAMGSKGSLRSGKHNSLGTAALDRKCRQFTDSSANSLKGSSNVGKGFSGVMKGSELSVDHSFTSAASSVPSLDTNKATSANPVPATNTDLPLSLSSSSDVSVPSQDKNFNVEAKDAISKINCSYDEDQKAWIPQGRKAELVSILVQRQKEMQAHMQDSTAWAHDKVVRAARHLAKEKEELQSLRKEKEESDRLQEEERTLEESTRKKILEMESAISRTNAHLEKVDASARRREAENAQLRMQLDAAKRHEVESAIKLDELSRKNEETLKRSQYCESERAVLQDELAAEKSKLSKVLQQLQHSKEKEDQIQARSKQEEAGKFEAIACVTSERKEREHIEISSRAEENELNIKAENDMQRYKIEVRALEQQISQLKVSLDPAKVAAPRWGTDNKSYTLPLSEGRKSSNTPILVLQDFSFDDVQRDQECVMCLSEEMSVVFLPCRHQVVCGKCNDLHEKQGMNDCPSCRTPIQRRVCVRPADS